MVWSALAIFSHSFEASRDAGGAAWRYEVPVGVQDFKVNGLSELIPTITDLDTPLAVCSPDPVGAEDKASATAL